MQGIHASSPSLDACISLARDARVDACMSCPGRAHESTCLLWPAVLAVGPLCISEVFMCMSYDWGITIIVHTNYVQSLICHLLELDRVDSGAKPHICHRRRGSGPEDMKGW